MSQEAFILFYGSYSINSVVCLTVVAVWKRSNATDSKFMLCSGRVGLFSPEDCEL